MPGLNYSSITDEVAEVFLSSGERYELHLEDERVSLRRDGEEVGYLSFRIIEHPAGPGDSAFDVARLTHAFIEGAPHGHGLGTTCVQFFLDCTGYELELPRDDGIQKSDGSHLVGKGPSFVASLRRAFGMPDVEPGDEDDYWGRYDQDD